MTDFLDKKDDHIIDEPEDRARSRRIRQHWLEQIEDVDRKIEQWQKRGTDIQRRFRDDRNKATEEGQRRLNTLWGWYETVKPAVYGQIPQANVERKHLDHDPTGRMSSQILERSLRSELEINGFDHAMHRSVADYLLVGRGQVWVRYEPLESESVSIAPVSDTDLEDSQGEIEPRETPTNDEQTTIDDQQSQEDTKLEDTGSELIVESAVVDYVNWKDFRYYPADARTWPEVTAVSKDVYLSKDQCIKRFGKTIGEQIAPEGLEPKRGLHQDTVIQIEDKKEQKRRITEIWDRETKKVYWVSRGYQYLCDEKDDPLKLTNFFPCPEPLDAINTTDTLVPIPFYHQFQDQSLQIDELTNRINMLTKSLKACGVYDASAKGFQRLLNENTENSLIPIENWIGADAGKSLEGAVSWMPIQNIAEVLNGLNDQLEKQLQKLDLITGISDILRGTSDARETMGAQRLKANASGTRVEDMRKKVGRFARDTVRLLSEVIAKHFSNKTLVESSGIFYEEGIPNELGLTILSLVENGFTPPGQQSQPPLGLPPPGPQAAPPAAPALPPPSPGLQPPGSPGPAPGAPGAMPPQPGLPVPSPGMPPPGSPPAAPSPMGTLMPVFGVVMKLRKAIDLLRDDVAKAYRIEIEVDTLVAGDHQEERQAATEFIGEVTKFIGEAGQMIQANPTFAPLAGSLLQWGVRKFRTGRDLEAKIDEFVDQITKQAQQQQANPQSKPNPEEIKAQTEQARSKAEIAKAQLDEKAAADNDQREAQLAQQDFQLKQMEMQMRMAEMQREAEFKQAEHQRRMQELMITHAMKPPVITPGMQ